MRNKSCENTGTQRIWPKFDLDMIIDYECYRKLLSSKYRINVQQILFKIWILAHLHCFA